MTDPRNFDSTRLARVAEDSRYRRLVRRRGRFELVLTAIILGAYFGYILLIAFNKTLLATPIRDGVTSLGIPIGVGIILLSILLTAIYVWRANREFDTLLEEIRRDHES
jgi:uncharacterized membrane protein (DUF485 family)